MCCPARSGLDFFFIGLSRLLFDGVLAIVVLSFRARRRRSSGPAPECAWGWCRGALAQGRAQNGGSSFCGVAHGSELCCGRMLPAPWPPLPLAQGSSPKLPPPPALATPPPA